MRLFRINGQEVDIDDATAIGLTLQSYDVKQPGKRFVNITNTFDIPATAHNLSLFGFASNPQSTSTKIFNNNYCDYWVDNEHLIDNARVRVEEIGERIKLFVFKKDDVWDLTELFEWPTFASAYLEWLQTTKGYPTFDNPYTGNFSAFIYQYTESTSDICLPFTFGNHYEFDPDEDGTFLEGAYNLWLKYYYTENIEGELITRNSMGGHFCAYAKSIFEFIEYRYGVNFLTGGGGAVGNIWDDPIAQRLYIEVKDITIKFKTDGGVVTGYYFEVPQTKFFAPYEDVVDKGDKTVYNFCTSFFQHLNIIIDDINIGASKAYRLARFDDIGTLADCVDFSGNFTGKPIYKPAIDGYAQKNSIKFDAIYEGGDSSVNSKTLTCGNKNIDATADLFSIDAYIPNFLPVYPGIVPNLSKEDAFGSFTFMLHGEKTDAIINIHASEANQYQVASHRLFRSVLYNLDSEYNTLNALLQAPRFYTVKKWLTLSDIKNIEFFKQYFIRELNGSYFINKITGFNPQKSNEATTIELIKISDRTPVTPPDLNYWVDGVGDPWFLGGDYTY